MFHSSLVLSTAVAESSYAKKSADVTDARHCAGRTAQFACSHSEVGFCTEQHDTKMWVARKEMETYSRTITQPYDSWDQHNRLSYRGREVDKKVTNHSSARRPTSRDESRPVFDECSLIESVSSLSFSRTHRPSPVSAREKKKHFPRATRLKARYCITSLCLYLQCSCAELCLTHSLSFSHGREDTSRAAGSG